MRKSSKIVRSVFFVVSLIHGVIHFAGFIQSWQISASDFLPLSSVFTIPDHELTIAGMAFLVTAIIWIMVAFAIALGKQSWWKLGIPAVLVSQTLIVLYSTYLAYQTILNICVLVLIVLSFFKEKFKHRVQRETKELLRSSNNRDTTIITEESLRALPQVVQRWLRRSNIIGTAHVHTAHLKQKGTMRTKPSGKWMEMRAEQFLITKRPGFIWSASINAAPFIFIKGRDLYKDGKGSMLIKVMNTLTLAKSKGVEIDQGSLMRYLAEIMWVPCAALCDFIRWEYVNDTAARAVLIDGKNTVSGIFAFDSNGDVISFEGKRYADLNDRYSLETWFIKINGYKEFNGIRIANKSDVSWKLKTGDFHWLTVEVTDIEYNFSTTKTMQVAEAPPVTKSIKNYLMNSTLRPHH